MSFFVVTNNFNYSPVELTFHLERSCLVDHTCLAGDSFPPIFEIYGFLDNKIF